MDTPSEIEITWGGAGTADGGNLGAGATPLHYVFGGLLALGLLACTWRCALDPWRNMCVEHMEPIVRTDAALARRAKKRLHTQ